MEESASLLIKNSCGSDHLSTNGSARQNKRNPLAGRFMLVLLFASVLTGAFRVHFAGLGAANEEKLYALKRSGALSGFIYRSVWNNDDRLVFVNSTFKAVVDVSALEEAVKERLSAGAFVTLTHYYIYENESPRNPGVFNFRRYLLSRGITYSVKLFADGLGQTGINSQNAFPGVLHLPGAVVRAAIKNRLGPLLKNDYGPLTAAIMTGDTGALDENIKDNFRNGGVSHLMAVSGMHVTFVLLPLRALVKNKRTGFRARQILLLLPVSAFLAVADFSASVMRAGIGAIYGMLSAAFRRPNDRFNALCCSAALQIFINPYVIFGTGFILSYASVLALLFIAPGISKLFLALKYRERRGIKKIDAVNRSALSAGISVNIVLMPLSALFFGSVSPVAIVTTLYASPLAAGICIGGYVLFLCASLDFLYVFRPIKWILTYMLRGVCRVVSLIAGLGGSLPPPIGRINVKKPPVYMIILIYIIILLIFSPLRERAVQALGKIKNAFSGRTVPKIAAVIAGACVITLVIDLNIERPIIEALVIDVGQGSAMLIKADGYAGLIDTGDGKTDVAEVIRASGVRRLDFVVLSHGHSDHTGGFGSILSEFAPASLFVSEDSTPSLMKAENDALEAGWKVTAAGNGDNIKLGRVTMSFIVADSFFGGRSDADENNASLCVVFSCTYGSIIVTGDLQKEGEEELCEGRAFPDVDVLIAPHHGSASGSGTKMLSLTSPEYAIISVGLKNSYGHPSKEAVGRLEASGAAVLRTDSGGGIGIVIRHPGIFRRKKVSVWQTL